MDYNMANKRVCDVLIRTYKTKTPYLLFDTANVTTQSVTGESVYAMARGQKRVGFDEPPEGTMTIEAQVWPFKLYAMLSDGTIYADAAYPFHEKITATEAGKLTLSETPYGGVAVFANGEVGGTGIEGSVSAKIFTATTAGDIVVDSEYEVCYVVSRQSGLKRVSIGSNFETQDYEVSMSTLNKDERGVLTPFILIGYKCHPNRNLELSQSSAGDPATITMNFDLLETNDNKFFDMIEDTERAD